MAGSTNWPGSAPGMPILPAQHDADRSGHLAAIVTHQLAPAQRTDRHPGEGLDCRGWLSTVLPPKPHSKLSIRCAASAQKV